MKTAAEENELPWYAVHVRSNFERSVYKHLEAKNYHVFLPTYRVDRQWSDRVKQIDVPLFPGYVFCRLDVQYRTPILSVPGVVQIVGSGKSPIRVPDSEIAAVQTALNTPLPLTPWESFTPGQRVIVDSGPLLGVEGVLLGVKQPYQLIISITLLHRAIAVEIDPAWVRPVEDNRGAGVPAGALTGHFVRAASL